MAHQVFDIEKLANFFAINELSGRHHAARYPNMRFYYNPVTSLLEPIAYDINYILPANYIEGDNNRIEVKEDREASFTDAFFSDRIFFSKYIQALQQVSDKEWLDSFFKSIKKEYNEKLIILSTETPSYFFDGKDILYDNQEFLKKILNIDKGMQAYFKQYNKDSNLLEIELGNIQMFPIEVIDMQYSDEILFMPSTGIYLPSKEALKPIEFVVEEFLISDQIIWSDEMVDDLNVRYKILGTDNILQQPVIPWAHLDDNFIENDFIRQEPNWKEFGFIQTNEELKQITIEPGSWKIGKNLIIPEGYHFVLGEGTELDLSNSAKILSYSPLEFIGSEDRPIVIKSADSAGQGIVVINSKNISILKYVNFDNLTAPTQGDWGLTGAITFYESPVDIYYCKFTKNRESDDYLNIIRSEFIIDTSLFNNTFADAVDIDFSNGSILNSTFIDCGNGDGNGDCLDFSGSGVELNGILINRAGDKGISIGENSQVVGNGIEVGNSRIAVASKDLSEVVLDNVTIHDSEIGYAVYQKKSEYGPASIKISTDNSENVKTYYLLEEGSSLILRNEKMKPNHKDVYMSLYGE
ncbi:hypothetical protein KKF61_01090, partial [Patescibacteria group bacterium]|nr:hypothetical protein [Patescibacteria group bacterium]